MSSRYVVVLLSVCLIFSLFLLGCASNTNEEPVTLEETETLERAEDYQASMPTEVYEETEEISEEAERSFRVRGNYFEVLDPADLEAAMQEIARDILSR